MEFLLRPRVGAGQGAYLVVQVGGSCNGLFSESAAFTDALGSSGAVLTIPNGIAVKSGAHLGVYMVAGILNHAKLYGYLAKDR